MKCTHITSTFAFVNCRLSVVGAQFVELWCDVMWCDGYTMHLEARANKACVWLRSHWIVPEAARTASVAGLLALHCLVALVIYREARPRLLTTLHPTPLLHSCLFSSNIYISFHVSLRILQLVAGSSALFCSVARRCAVQGGRRRGRDSRQVPSFSKFLMLWNPYFVIIC